MKNLFLICWLLIASTSFGQQLDINTQNKALDEIVIGVAKFYLHHIKEDSIPANISTRKSLHKYIQDKEFKKNDQIKKYFQKIYSYKPEENTSLSEFIDVILSDIKLDKKSKIDLKSQLQAIAEKYKSIDLGDETGMVSNEVTSENIQVQQSPSYLNLERKNKELEKENKTLRDSLSHYRNLNITDAKTNTNNDYLKFALMAIILTTATVIIYAVVSKYLPSESKENIQSKPIQNKPMNKPKSDHSTNMSVINKEQPTQEEGIEKEVKTELTNTTTIPPAVPTPITTHSPVIPSDQYVNNSMVINNNNWFVIGASVIGKAHLEGDIPCQDFHWLEEIDKSWGVAVSCDGAGSAPNSKIGAEFVAKECTRIFKGLVLKKEINQYKTLPKNEDWQEFAEAGLYQVRTNLDEFANNKGYKIESLACTVIVVVYSPLGLLVAHIGDGRAGFLNQNNEWKPIITPWKGEEANQTVFITSAIWNKKLKDYLKCEVINEAPLAFTLMSDGCETHSFECSVINRNTNEWHDPNIPYPKFFNPLVETLQKLRLSDLSENDIKEKWQNFLLTGTQSLSNEPDDKTLILGIFINQSEK